VRSSHSHFVKASGLRWLCLMLVAPIPWAKRCWALPFCSVLAPSERYYLERGRRPNKLPDRARQLLLMLKHWLPERSIVVVADTSFAALELLDAVRHKFCVVTCLRLDAALYDPAPPRAPGARGRPRLKKYLLEQKPMATRHAAWYDKDRATFSDTIAMLRRSIWGAHNYNGAEDQHDMVKIPRALFDHLTETVSYAV
jgi:hypothetical protein